MMDDVFLIRNALVVVKMILSPTPSKTFCNGLDFEIQGITFSVFEPIKLASKKES